MSRIGLCPWANITRIFHHHNKNFDSLNIWAGHKSMSTIFLASLKHGRLNQTFQGGGEPLNLTHKILKLYTITAL